jgi:hypothetical protein
VSAGDGALFDLVEGWFVPGPLTTGPWRPDAMHGGPPSALIGRAIEQALDDGEQVGRINIELERPVIVAPLRVDVARRQVSRRVAYLDVRLGTAEQTITTARAVVLRGEPVVGAELPHADPPPLAGPESTVQAPGGAHDSPTFYHRDAIEHRFESGGFEIPGSATAWMRLAVALVAGEDNGSLSGLLAVADFGSAIGQGALQPEMGVGLINVDVSVAMLRRPVGPWFRLATTDDVTSDGIGLAHTTLSDVTGPLGVATHSQLTYAYRR